MHQSLFLIFWVALMISNYFVIPSKSLPFLPANNITVYGDAYFTENSIGLTQERPTCISPPSSPLSSSIGRAFYVYPIRFLDQQSNTTASFTCRFSFSITPSRACPFGDGLAFLITSRTDSFSFSNGYFGLPLESFIAVEFDTSFDSAIGDINGNHVGVDVNTVISFAAIDAASKGVDLKSERKITAWIEYRDALKLIRVWVGYESTIRPSSPVLAAYVDLSNQFHEYMHVGFSASNGQGSAVHIVSHWQFKTFTTSSNSNDTPLDSVQEGDCLMCTPGDLVDFNDTVDDNKTIKLGNDGGSRLGVKGLTAIILSVVVVICIIIVILILRFCKIVCIKNNGSQDLSSSSSQMSSIPVRWPISEIRASTLGFHPSRIIGRGASAKVYRGSLASGELVAVKRFERKNQIDCVKNPFTTEFATMVGCLKHKNLVQLQGWCCEETELILVYEYLPNGSLDKLLHYKSHSAILLSWEQRLNILLGVGSALLYLHEECDRQIIHRDVKTCNIMIDAEYNAKLGDFGLAEVYEHCSETRLATMPAGTMGYLAPEYVYAGIPTEKTDVYSFGVVVLEVTSGKRPVDDDGTVLVDWVWGLWEKGILIEAVDPKLTGQFNPVMMERMLMVGLSCVHPNHVKRPKIRESIKILNGDAPLPVLPARKPSVTLRSILPMNPQEIFNFNGEQSPEDDAPWLTPRSHFS